MVPVLATDESNMAPENDFTAAEVDRYAVFNTLLVLGKIHDFPPTWRAEVLQMDGCRIIASVIIPPLGVFLQVGFGWEFWLNILLTLLGYIPGLIHAIWVIARKD
jgi:uncharacterized membrane protein YqaE (UPF0057 family)